eukprot:TRINITY_DN3340_c0_g1_i1.p1 TRINITY_DN3340_c0_g1~~TRINITY_DN3340_c0_g1_i1.p1  ORF type:complete len:221 (+),score=42.35 TRINITY_DN3340_c0_g1_i1:35-697(+)
MRSVFARLRSPTFRSNVRSFIPAPKSDAIKALESPEVVLSRAQRLKNYLNMVKYDYTEALKEIKDFAVNKPFKAVVTGSLLGFGLYSNKTNPDEHAFRENFLINGQELCQVGDPIRNPSTQNLQDYVSKAYNAGLLRRLNLGVCSVMWVDDYDQNLGLFAARCDYLKPGWLDIRHRVIDVGFIGKWWISSKKMEEFDVNVSEWNVDGTPVNKSEQLKQMW